MTTTPRNTTLSIINEVCSMHCVSLTAVLGHKRPKELVAARNEISYRLRNHGYHWIKIARVMNRDHSSIIQGYKNHVHKLEATCARQRLISAANAYQPQATQ